jgi:hypothetical protein
MAGIGSQPDINAQFGLSGAAISTAHAEKRQLTRLSMLTNVAPLDERAQMDRRVILVVGRRTRVAE